MEKTRCPVCKSSTDFSLVEKRFARYYNCPVCGRFELSYYAEFDYNKLAAYLAHHQFKSDTKIEYRYHTDLDKETCDKYKEDFKQGNLYNGHPVHMNLDIINNWYPKRFSDRVDYILLYLNSKVEHVGQEISLSFQEILSSFFIDRYESRNMPVSDVDNLKSRTEEECKQELRYMLDYLKSCSYVTHSVANREGTVYYISILPNGYARIDELQKNTSNGRNVLVAMKFGEDTIPLREAIRKGIKDAEYNAIFIDEVQHNDFITPELLKYIRDSKFVVVDLTHQNNGAYFEEGYAMGLGKPVIQLCKKDTKLHFDIAQKNTIMWGTEEEIPAKLKNRIKATID